MRGCEPSVTHFQQGIENQGFNQIKKFLRQITPKNKLHYLAKKKFGFRCLILVWDIWTFVTIKTSKTSKGKPNRDIYSE